MPYIYQHFCVNCGKPLPYHRLVSQSPADGTLVPVDEEIHIACFACVELARLDVVVKDAERIQITREQARALRVPLPVRGAPPHGGGRAAGPMYRDTEPVDTGGSRR